MITPPAQLKDQLLSLRPHLGLMIEGAYSAYSMQENPLRYISTAHVLRELLREVLAHFSPDTSILEASYFVPDPDPSAHLGITRKHRAIFAVYGYVNPSVLSKTLSYEVDNIASRIAKHVRLLSDFAHPRAETIARPDAEGDALVHSTLQLFIDLLKAVDNGKLELTDCLQADLSLNLANLFTNDFFDELDQLSSHTRPTDAEVLDVIVTRVARNNVYFAGSGSVYCDLQYGSDGDCRRGDGSEWADSFPFTFKGYADTKTLTPEVSNEDVLIDVSKYEPDEY